MQKEVFLHTLCFFCLLLQKKKLLTAAVLLTNSDVSWYSAAQARLISESWFPGRIIFSYGCSFRKRKSQLLVLSHLLYRNSLLYRPLLLYRTPWHSITMGCLIFFSLIMKPDRPLWPPQRHRLKFFNHPVKAVDRSFLCDHSRAAADWKLDHIHAAFPPGAERLWKLLPDGGK